MHKCDNLPNYKEAGVECLLTIEESRRGARGCVNWNQVLNILENVILLIFSISKKSAKMTRLRLCLTSFLRLLIQFNAIM